MRKDRNTFFSESNMFQSNYPQMGGQQPVYQQQPLMAQQPMYQQQPMMQPMPTPAPYQQSTASNSFYTGPAPTPNYNQAAPGISSDIESRLAKMERQIRRLETRLNKIESTHVTHAYQGIEEVDTNYSNSMYMI